jgi:hypothetical protein
MKLHFIDIVSKGKTSRAILTGSRRCICSVASDNLQRLLGIGLTPQKSLLPTPQ